ncbi:S9 family peptidase [Nakamurella lactea]|uniref:S9 family peptidase n=1 Tax=Nakamurella lactea TaxID=459515 RepID=UPI000406DF2F|nr:prolyl oligopeptidase family serine peptidase [Nakamurella lactea]
MNDDLDPRYREFLRFADHVANGDVRTRWADSGLICSADGRHWSTDLSTRQTRPLDREPPVAARPIRSAFKIGRPTVFEVPGPGGEFFATEVGDDLGTRWAVDDRIVPLTNTGEPRNRWDGAGATWSPDGLQLLARRTDTRRMDLFPVVHWLKPREEVDFFPAGSVGGAVESTRAFVIHRISRDAVEVDSGPEPEQDLRPVGWSADGKQAYLLKANRYKNPYVLLAVDPATGATRVVREERSTTWVSYWEKGLSVTLLPRNEGQLWLSERSGFAHLYRHDDDGVLVATVTAGDWAVTRVFGVDEAGGWVYFEAHSDPDHPYDVHLGRARLDGGGVETLTSGRGVHSGSLSPDRRWLADRHASMENAPVVDLLAVDGKQSQRVLTGEIKTPADAPWTPPEEFTVIAADGVTVLHGQLFLPADFDPQRSYPVIESIYAGPNSAFVPQQLLDANGIQSHALAQLGFAVVMLDGRGTPERSKEFHDVAYRNFAGEVISDHVAALRELAQDRPYLDLDRVGVYGRSYGGYFTARALLEAPEVYKVGVAVNGVYEMREGNGPGPIECVMGPLADDIAGYDKLSLYPMLDRLVGKLLIVHGTSDVNVPFAASLQLVDKLMEAGKPFDFLPVNEQPHHFSGFRGEYVSSAMARYFLEHLGGSL